MDFDPDWVKVSVGSGDATLREIETCRAHTGVVWCLSWNPDSGVHGIPAMFASCGADKAIIWEQDATTGSFQCKTSTITWCAWAAFGTILVTSSIDGSIWKRTGIFTVINEFQRFKQPVSVSINGCGDVIATCHPEKNTILIWKIANELEMFFKLSSIEDTQGYTQLVQWHPCKHIIFACGFDNTIKIWVPDASMLNWECIQTLGESDGVHGHKIWALAFNGRGNKVVTCSDNGTITIWSLDIDGMQYGGKHFLNGIHLGSLTGYHDQHINSVLWSREGEEKICTAAADGVMCFFIENGEKLYSDNIESPYKLLLKKNHAHEKAINSIQWCSQDNSRLASASDDGTIKIWELASLQV